MKSKFFAKIFGLVCCMLTAVTFNAAAGATLAVAVGCAPGAGAVAGNVVALVAGHFAPAGVLRAGVFTEIWTGEQIKQFRTAIESWGWLARIRGYNEYVKNDVIHFVEIGGDPKVLVNNTTYPIPVTALEDADKPVSLDKFSTEATPVTDDELHAISYDKMASVQERHRDVLVESFGARGAHDIKLGKAAGVQMLRDTLSTMPPQQKPGEVINLGKQSAPGAGEAPKTYTKLSEVPEAERLELRKNNRAEYMRLFKEEYGVECPALD